MLLLELPAEPGRAKENREEGEEEDDDEEEEEEEEEEKEEKEEVRMVAQVSFTPKMATDRRWRQYCRQR